MEQLFEYARLLGVKPGANAEEVRTAFRTRIKIHHPDRATSGGEASAARSLIEAYQALKNGWPAHLPTQYQKPAAPSANPAYERGRAAGRRIFEEAVGDRRESLFRNFFNDFARAAFAEDDDIPYSSSPREYVEKAEYRRQDFRVEPDNEYLGRAEAALRETVRKFSRKTNQSRKQWSKEYIFHLLNVQVLYRDAARRYPAVYGQAMGRLRQIQELMVEIKAMAR